MRHAMAGVGDDMAEPVFERSDMQRVARVMAAKAGVERTPEQWESMFGTMIADYRRWHPQITDGKSDAEVWDMIVVLVNGKADDEPPEPWTGWESVT